MKGSGEGLEAWSGGESSGGRARVAAGKDEDADLWSRQCSAQLELVNGCSRRRRTTTCSSQMTSLCCLRGGSGSTRIDGGPWRRRLLGLSTMGIEGGGARERRGNEARVVPRGQGC